MKKSSYGNKEYKLIHQILCLTAVDFSNKTIYGFAELHILPLVNHLSRIKVNCKQSKIFRICVKGSGLDTWLEASFLTQDPGINFCPDTVQNVDVLLNKLEAAVLQTEPDQNGGEIIVQLPSETIPLIAEKKTLRISIEFVLEDPKGGIHFVNPEIEGSPVKRKSHLFTYKYGNSSRLWFPCIDSFSEVCTWKIEVTTDIGMIVVCPGNLVEKVYTSDEKQATHHFILSTPTSASNIGLAIGPFEVVVDQELSDVMCFVLPGLSPLVNHTTSFLGDAIEFFEETLNAQYPFSAYKLVFVDEAFMSSQTFTSMNILSTNLLHPESVIEQTFISRKILVNGLAEQFFGMFVGMHSWCDLWLIQGIFRYLAGLFLKKHFGNNDYKLWLHKELELLCNYELVGPGLPPLYPYSLVTHPIDGKQESTNEISQSSAIQQHPHIISSRQLKMIGTKSHFVMRIIELRIGQDLLLQAFNKSLSLASAAAAKNTDMMLWSNMLLSTTGFLKTISTVSGKDINIFLDQWICHSGVAKINASFSFNRKRNIIELEVTQCVGKGCQKYVGPMILCIQELDGSFPHTVQVEDIISQHELPCHSKSRRNKKKKIPLITGDEVDMDLSVTLDSDSPVLWVRIDPDMTWPRHVSLQQPDYMWQYQLRYERDVTSQIEAVRALEKYPCSGTRSALIDTINNVEAFFKVRIEAAFCLAKIANTEVEVWDGESAMIEIFEKMFGSNACASIPKFNNFSNFTGYFMQKVLPTSISMLKNSQSQCTRRTLQFILELLKYNDNRFNQFHDGFYVSSLIDGLKNVIGPALHLASATSFDERKNLPVDEHAKLVLSEVVCRLNMDKIIPSFRYAVTCSCLKVIRCMQTNGHIPAESALFKKYSKYGLFEDIRITALKIMVDFVSVHFSETDFDWLLKILENEPSPRVKHTVLQCLVDTPPLLNQTQINNYGSIMYTRLWKLINFDSASNYRFRCDVIDFLKVMYAKYPKASLSTSELKEKKEKGTVHSEFLKREEPAVKKKRTSSRESTSRESSPKLNILDSDLSSKIKLKIKFGGDDVSHVSGHDYPGNIVTKQKNADENLFAKKQKKKKKKKHKEKHKMPLDIPGTYSNMLDDRLAADDSPLGTLNMPISSGYISGSPELS
ncbi:transcription initiation factor TFIID subunit 2 isoform X3 [Hydra vulgaris]|uniref:Transcription initiation factor TFIID subunit 2 n=2 Tax=Hydra vulgaris TaxID=6087 RepID=A0ABM4BEA4_HYDVU